MAFVIGHRILSLLATLVLPGLLATGCGGASSKSSSAPTPASSAGGSSPGALSAEAQSKATGDIPDTQAFLTFRDRAAGFTIRYPEGWAQQGSGANITFRDKNNQIRVVITHGAPPTPAGVQSALKGLKAANPSLQASPAQQLTIRKSPVIKVSYRTQSTANPVTGKRVTLTVDRYVYFHAGKVATLDLGTPVGVDNVDAYRMISESFTWL